VNDYNTSVIGEFRANHGKVGGPFADTPLLLLHHRGARTGAARVNPLAYQKLDPGYAVFASKGGAPTNPDWLYNVQAHPDVQAEIGDDTYDLRARVATPKERAPIWERQKRLVPRFGSYEQKTSRSIPVVILEPMC
jgi:deazaflavin-dependent oxidoreductase (nitroreductase family)